MPAVEHEQRHVQPGKHVRRELGERGFLEDRRGILVHPAPQDARGEIALQHRILEQPLPAAIERSLIARVRRRAQAGELGGEIRGEPLELRAQRERLVIGSVRGPAKDRE